MQENALANAEAADNAIFETIVNTVTKFTPTHGFFVSLMLIALVVAIIAGFGLMLGKQSSNTGE